MLSGIVSIAHLTKLANAMYLASCSFRFESF